MGGKFMISFPKANREITGLKADDVITVVLELDEGIREVVVPAVLQNALETNKLPETFNKLSYTKRKEFARQVNDARTDETRERRVEKVVSAVKAGA